MNRHRVHVRLTDPSGVAVKGARLTLSVKAGRALLRQSAYLTLPLPEHRLTNVHGYAQFDLLPNEVLGQGSTYELTILSMAGRTTTRFTVEADDPEDLEWADLSRRLEPAPRTPTYLEDPCK
jgi:hypothetical protein